MVAVGYQLLERAMVCGVGGSTALVKGRTVEWHLLSVAPPLELNAGGVFLEKVFYGPKRPVNFFSHGVV